MLVEILLSLLAALAATSYKYLPGAYSIRFFWVSAKYVYLKKLASSNAAKKTPFMESVRKTRCCLLECDFFGFHKNNCTYFTELDICRTECVLDAIHTYFKSCYLKGENFAFVPLASICNHFLKEIKPFQNYEMHTKIVGWGDKWVWLITVFTIDEKVRPVLNPKPVYGSHNHVPENIPPLYLNLKEGATHGKRVSCLSVGKLVFKKGRDTIKPWDVSQMANFTDPKIDELAKKNEIKVCQNTNNVIELLKIYQETPSSSC